jgi:putative chitinase
MDIIRNFQLQNGLLADGVLGKKTLQHLKKKLNVDSDESMAHLIGQISVESAYFTTSKENLNYARNPEKIASKVYANRFGNGDESTGDGFKYSGKGGIQLTFKANYEAFGACLGVDLVKNPDLVATDYFFEVAKWFFDHNKIWELTSSVDNESIINVSKKVNGGLHSIDERIKQTTKYYKMLKDK